MRTHPGQRIRVRDSKNGKCRKDEVSYLGVFYRGQDSKGEPDHYLSFEQCKDLRSQGLGAFINRGTAFRRFDVSTQQDSKQYFAGSRHNGSSLVIDETMMNRFVSGDAFAIEAVNAWG